MSAGRLEAIYITSVAAAPMRAVENARAVAGKGIAGDRYHDGGGTFAKPNSPGSEVTLIEQEAVEAAAGRYEIELVASQTRRNLVTRGVALNHLVGHEFSIGAARFRGIRLCEPCSHLEKLVGKDTLKSLIHRGGLRAQVICDGEFEVGDEVCVHEETD